MKQSFYPGDIVRIVNDGQTYSTYLSFFDRDGLRGFKEAFRKSSDECLIGWQENNGDTGIVLAAAPHTMNSAEIIYVVECLEKGYTTLISEDGIELVLQAIQDVDDIDLSEILK